MANKDMHLKFPPDRLNVQCSTCREWTPSPCAIDLAVFCRKCCQVCSPVFSERV